MLDTPPFPEGHRNRCRLYVSTGLESRGIPREHVEQAVDDIVDAYRVLYTDPAPATGFGLLRTRQGWAIRDSDLDLWGTVIRFLPSVASGMAAAGFAATSQASVGLVVAGAGGVAGLVAVAASLFRACRAKGVSLDPLQVLVLTAAKGRSPGGLTTTDIAELLNDRPGHDAHEWTDVEIQEAIESLSQVTLSDGTTTALLERDSAGSWRCRV